MSDIQYGIIGAAIGLAIAVAGNVFVLPTILNMRRKRYESGWKPLVGKANPELADRMIKLQYRVVMPLLFTFVGFQLGSRMLGAQ